MEFVGKALEACNMPPISRVRKPGMPRPMLVMEHLARSAGPVCSSIGFGEDHDLAVCPFAQ
jgi:hypothetical protein